MVDDLKVIKDNYGENMSNLCRDLFPSLLEQKGLLSDLMLSNLHPSHYLYDDIVNAHLEKDFEKYIYYLISIEENRIVTNKSVKELLEEAGYDFYECHTEEELEKFKKHYAWCKRLSCYSRERLNKCYLFFAVKKNVENIKPSSWSGEEYKSVISIQFSKGKVSGHWVNGWYKQNTNLLSINNTSEIWLDWPDPIFGNNLDNIIPGLTNAFAREYNFNIGFDPPTENEFNFVHGLGNYTLAKDGKYYRYNQVISMNHFGTDPVYFCPDNVIIERGLVKELDKNRYLLIDYFVIDLVENKIREYDGFQEDAFANSFSNINKIYVHDNIQTKGKTITVISNNAESTIIEVNKYNQIVGLKYNYLDKIGDYFLCNSEYLIEFSAPNLTKIGNYFLASNKTLRSINVPKVEYIGEAFLKSNRELTIFEAPNLKYLKGGSALFCNQKIERFYCPKLSGDYFCGVLRPHYDSQGNMSQCDIYGNKVIKLVKKK